LVEGVAETGIVILHLWFTSEELRFDCARELPRDFGGLAVPLLGLTTGRDFDASGSI